MEEIDIRRWENPIIKESYDWMLKLGDDLEEVVLAGGWATYLQAWSLGFGALPSLDIDFVALKSNFNTIEEFLIDKMVKQKQSGLNLSYSDEFVFYDYEFHLDIE